MFRQQKNVENEAEKGWRRWHWSCGREKELQGKESCQSVVFLQSLHTTPPHLSLPETLHFNPTIFRTLIVCFRSAVRKRKKGSRKVGRRRWRRRSLCSTVTGRRARPTSSPSWRGQPRPTTNRVGTERCRPIRPRKSGSTPTSAIPSYTTGKLDSPHIKSHHIVSHLIYDMRSHTTVDFLDMLPTRSRKSLRRSRIGWRRWWRGNLGRNISRETRRIFLNWTRGRWSGAPRY